MIRPSRFSKREIKDTLLKSTTRDLMIGLHFTMLVMKDMTISLSYSLRTLQTLTP
jgi:hypothetical protein